MYRLRMVVEKVPDDMPVDAVTLGEAAKVLGMNLHVCRSVLVSLFMRRILPELLIDDDPAFRSGRRSTILMPDGSEITGLVKVRRSELEAIKKVRGG